jgi:photosystem II stability/assembly factor-like uncharacterized protein
MRRIFPLLVALLVGCTPVTSSPSPPSATPSVVASSAVPASQTPTVAPTPSPTPIPLPSFAQVAPAGNGVVWALVAGSRLFVSTSRGDSWQERSVPRAATANPEIAFVNEREGWLLAPGSPATQCQVQPVTLYHTSDGALTWEQLSPTGIADADCKAGVAFSDATHGYFGTFSPNAAPRVYRTADGGRTWVSSQPVADPPGFTSGPAGFELRVGPVADFGNAKFVYAVGQNNGQPRGFVLRSSDGGATWVFTSTPTRTDIGVNFVTPTRWVSWLLPQPSAETTDGGATWHPFPSDYQQAAPVAPQIAFGDALTGYATVRGSIQRTTDGGAHWSAIKTPGT